MDDSEVKIEKLKEYFRNRGDVVMAFLFGSQAKGYARAGSDWDIGVYLTVEDRTREQRIWTDIESIVNANADLVVLNRAATKIAWPIVGSGLILAIKDRDAYMKEVARLSEEADAWYSTADEFYRIFLRSASLSETDRSRLQEIVEFLEDAVTEYDRFRSVTQVQYVNEKDLKRNMEHWIEHLVSAAVDIAKIIWASERRPLPERYRDFLIALGGIAPFNENDDCARLAEWVYLRNALAHEYLDYRWKRIASFLNATEPLFRTLTERTRMFLERATPGKRPPSTP